MRFIPDLMVQKIRRQNPTAEAPQHPSVEHNKKVHEAMEQEEQKLHEAAMRLKGSNPEAWALYEEALLSMYRGTKTLQGSGFFALLSNNSDPQYYTFTQIYAQAKIEILEAILSISQVPIEKLQSTSKNKVNFIVDLFRKKK